MRWLLVCARRPAGRVDGCAQHYNHLSKGGEHHDEDVPGVPSVSCAQYQRYANQDAPAVGGLFRPAVIPETARWSHGPKLGCCVRAVKAVRPTESDQAHAYGTMRMYSFFEIFKHIDMREYGYDPANTAGHLTDKGSDFIAENLADFIQAHFDPTIRRPRS